MHRCISLFTIFLFWWFQNASTSKIRSVVTSMQWCEDTLHLKADICSIDDKCSCYCTNWGEGDANVAYFGEFGYELALHLPYVYYLHSRNLLKSTAGPYGTKPFYYFSPNHLEHNVSRKYCKGPPAHRSLHTSRFNFEQWLPPPLKEIYRTKAIRFDKPLVIIHNKYTREWNGKPANFLDVPTLRKLFKLLTDQYTILYTRPIPGNTAGFSADHQRPAIGLLDYELLAEFPEVVTYQKLALDHPFEYNELQLRVHASCERFISIQGGSSYLASYFGGTNIVYAVKGQELNRKTPAYRTFVPRFAGTRIILASDYQQLIWQVQIQFVDATS